MGFHQKILIVDDRKENLIAMGQVLTGLDVEIIEAVSGNDALAATIDHDFAVMILDVMMPEMDGYELAGLLRSDDKTKMIPIIFVTAYSTDERQIFKGYEAGGIDYIVKPFDPQILLGKVKVFLELDDYREELRQHRDDLEVLVAERTAALTKRVKELGCLYAVSSLVAEPQSSIASAMEKAVCLIPAGWQYPEVTGVLITYDGCLFATPDFRDTEWKQSADIVLSGKTVGSVDVCYLEEKPIMENGPFLQEEQHLIDDIARQLGAMIERELIAEREKHLTAVLRSIRDVNQLIVHEKRRDRLIEGACERLVASRGFCGAWIVLTDDQSNLVDSACYGFEDTAFNGLTAMFETGALPACCRQCRSEEDVSVTVFPSGVCNECPMGHSYSNNAALTIGIGHNGQLFGWMGVSVPAEYADSEEELPLLVEIAGDIGFALYGIYREQERIKAEQFLRAIFQSASDGILVADVVSQRFVLNNEAMCRLLGYSVDEIKHLSVMDIHPAESLDHVFSQFEQHARGLTTIAEDIPMKRKDGSIFQADVSAAPIELEAHSYVVGIFRDITERKQAESKLQEAYDIINKSSTVVFTWRNQAGWPVEFVSENVEKLLGYSAYDLKSGVVNYIDCIQPDDRDRIAKEVEKYSSMAGINDFRHEPYHIIVKDGSEKVVNDWTFIDRDKQGIITHFKGIVEDITEQRRLEVQLRQSQKLEAIGRLSGGIAHDFNNILTAIGGYSEMIALSDDLPPDVKTNTDVIRTQVRRAAQLIRQILDFSRSAPMERNSLELVSYMKESCKLLERTIREDIHIEMNYEVGEYVVKADPVGLQQVIANLAVNAQDAMPDGGSLSIHLDRITLNTLDPKPKAQMPAGDYVKISISDTGSGMSSEVLDKVFEPFFTTKPKGKGTGLGLSQVFGIVQSHDGYIDVKSAPGAGTSFDIYLPADAHQQKVVEEDTRSDFKSGLKELILLVEDEEIVLEIGKKMLEKIGYKVITARDGMEALELFQNNMKNIALVVTDMTMPNMGGKDLIKRIKSIAPETRVIVWTGYPIDVEEISSEHKYIDWILKPPDITELAGMIKRALAFRKAPGSRD